MTTMRRRAIEKKDREVGPAGVARVRAFVAVTTLLTPTAHHNIVNNKQSNRQGIMR